MTLKRTIIYFSLIILPSFIGASLTTPTLTGFSQLQYVNDTSEDENQGFHLKRIRFGLQGDIQEELSYNIILGTTEESDRDPHLVNAYFDVHGLPFKLRVGQFLLPFGNESSTSVTKLNTIDRSSTVKALNPFNLFRDVGVQISQSFESASYKVALVNGTGANEDDDNDEKDMLGRFLFHPSETLTVGISGHLGYFQSNEETVDRSRLGLDLSYEKEGFNAIAEYITRTDNDTTSTGWYALAAYTFSNKWRGVSRYESYLADTASSEDTLTILTLGVDYFLSGYNRLSLNYEFRNDDTDPSMEDRITAQFQVVY